MNLLGGAGGPLVIATVAANVFFVPAIPIALLKNLNVFQAVKRSLMLTKQGYGRIFLLFLLYVVLCAAAVFAWVYSMAAVQPLIKLVWLRSLTALLGFLIVLLIPQLFMIALTLNYYDQRFRKENWTPGATGVPLG